MDTLDTKNSIDSYVTLLENSQGGISTYIGCDIRIPLNEGLKGIYNDIKYNKDIPEETREKLLDKMNSYMDSELSLTLNAPERGLPYLTEYLRKKLREDINNNVVQKNISNEIIFSYYVQRLVFSCLEEITQNNIAPFDVKKRPKKAITKDTSIEVQQPIVKEEVVSNETEEENFIPTTTKKKTVSNGEDPMEVSKRLIEEANKKAGLV